MSNTIVEDESVEQPLEAAKYFGLAQDIHTQWVNVLRDELSVYSQEEREAVLRDLYPPLPPRAVEQILAGDTTVFEPGKRVFSRIASLLGLLVEDYLPSPSYPKDKELERWSAFIKEHPIRVAAGTGGGPGATVPDRLDNLDIYLLTRAIDELD